MRCCRRLLINSYREPITNYEFHRKIQAAIGLLMVIKVVWPQLKGFWFRKKSQMVKEEQADRRKDGKTKLKSGRPGMGFPAEQGS